MAYIKYNDDPLAKRVSAAYAALCSTITVKKALKIVDRCFSIFSGSDKETSFCALQEFAYPVDSSLSIDFEVCAGETLVIYDNGTDLVPTYGPSGTTLNYPFGDSGEYVEAAYTDPSGTPQYYVVSNDRNYARGCMLYVKYPMTDSDGSDILPADSECQLKITNRNLDEFIMPLSDFFAHFVNPETRGADSLINKIEVVNPNIKFSVKVKGLIIYTKSNSDPSDCAC